MDLFFGGIEGEVANIDCSSILQRILFLLCFLLAVSLLTIGLSPSFLLVLG